MARTASATVISGRSTTSPAFSARRRGALAAICHPRAALLSVDSSAPGTASSTSEASR